MYVHLIARFLAELCVLEAPRIRSLSIFSLALLFVRRPSLVIHSHPFMHSFNPYSAELCVLEAPRIRSLSGIDACAGLVSLWVCNTQLEALGGLKNCVRLERVVLYKNRIGGVKDLSSLPLLTFLDLSRKWILRVLAPFVNEETNVTDRAKNQI